MSIFSELIEDYFLSNIKNNLFEDEDTEENEPVGAGQIRSLQVQVHCLSSRVEQLEAQVQALLRATAITV